MAGVGTWFDAQKYTGVFFFFFSSSSLPPPPLFPFPIPPLAFQDERFTVTLPGDGAAARLWGAISSLCLVQGHGQLRGRASSGTQGGDRVTNIESAPLPPSLTPSLPATAAASLPLRPLSCPPPSLVCTRQGWRSRHRPWHPRGEYLRTVRAPEPARLRLWKIWGPSHPTHPIPSPIPPPCPVSRGTGVWRPSVGC